MVLYASLGPLSNTSGINAIPKLQLSCPKTSHQALASCCGPQGMSAPPDLEPQRAQSKLPKPSPCAASQPDCKHGAGHRHHVAWQSPAPVALCHLPLRCSLWTVLSAKHRHPNFVSYWEQNEIISSTMKFIGQVSSRGNSLHPKRGFFQDLWALKPRQSNTDWAFCFSSIRGWASSRQLCLMQESE